MASLAQIRQQYPEYSDLSDQELADGLYGAFYSDMDRAEYDRSIGFAPQPAPPADVAPPPMLTSQMDPNPVLRAILGVDAPTPGMPGAMPAPTLTPPAPLPPDDLGLALDAYERKGLGEVTGERLRGGVLDVAAGQDMVGAAREADALATLDQARALLAAGAGVEEFAKLAEGQTRFPLNTLMDAGAVERAAALFEKRLPASVNRGVERQAEAAAVPRNPVLGAVIEAGNENGMFSREVLDTIMRDPLGVLGEAGVRSLPQSVAPIIGGLTMGPAGSALGSVAMTGGEGITSALQHYGVDVRDPAAVEAALRDPAMRTKVQEFTNARQAPIAAADMLTMGLASALAGRPLTNILSQLIVEPAGEMAGEAGAQLASTGEVDQGEVLAEGLGGVASGGAQATATSLMETIRQALSAPAQPQSAPPVPMSAPGAPDAPAAPVAAPAASPQPVRPTAPQPGKEPSNLFNDYVTGRTLRLYSGRVQGEPVTVTGMTADGITIQRQNGETDSIPASDLRDGFATLIDERGEIVRPTDAPAPPAAKPAPKRAGPADLSGVSDDTIANVGNAIFDSGLSNPEGAARVLMLPKEAEELRAAGIEISEEGVVSQDDIRALVEERESRGARRRPAPVQETTPRVPSPEEEAEATRIERAAAPVPELRPEDAGWVAINRDTGEVVLETAQKSVAEKVNREKYDVLTVGDYLGQINNDAGRAAWAAKYGAAPSAAPTEQVNEPARPRQAGIEDDGGQGPGGGVQGPDDARPGPGAARTGTAEGGDGLDPNITRRITEVGLPAANASDKDKVAWQIAVGLIRNRDGNLEHYFNGWNPLTPEQAKFLSDNGLTVPQQAAAPARSGTAEGGRVDLTRDGPQLVIPGAEQITDKQRAERKMEQPKRGGDAPPPDGGLFSPRGPELFDDRTGKSNRGFSLNDASEPTKSASSDRELEDGNYMEVFHWSPHDFEQLESGFEMTGEGGLDEGHGAYFTRWQISGLWYSSQNKRADDSFVYEVMVPADPHLLEWNVRRDKQRNKDLVGAVDSDLPVVKRSKPPRAEYDGINVKYQDGVGAYDAFLVTPQRSDFDANKAREDAAAESIEELGYYDSDDIIGRVSEKAQAAIDGYVIEEGPLAGTSYKSVKEMEDAVTSLYANDPPRRIQKWQQDEEFRSFYKRIEGALGSPEAASKWMEERGVRGHAYQSYDYGSPHNLVIYNPEKHTKVTGRLKRSEFSQRSFDILQKMAERNLKSDAEYSLPGPADWNRGKPVRSEGFSLNDAAAPKKPKPKSTGRQPKGSLGPKFLDFSFTDKNSVYEAAFRAAGIEPDKARLMSVDEQIATLRRVLLRDYGVTVELPTRTVKRKTITGRSVEETREQISPRDAIDQMLDAYRQMEMLAHVFGIPRAGIGLREGGTTGKGIVLSLVGRLRGALGMYSYDPEGGGSRKITLPGRSNSFAHEWGHALDHWLHSLVKPGEWTGMLSRQIQDGDIKGDIRQNRVAQAFIGVLQALYGKRAALAAMQIGLSVQAAQVNPKTGQPTGKAKKAQAWLQDIEAGKKLPQEAWSPYFRTSAAFDAMFGGGGYFTDPAEMFARAMEAYVSVKAAEVSDLPQSFLTKPNWAYTESDETRASLTFPRGLDEADIRAAMERLAGELRQMGVLGPGRASAPSDADIYQISNYDKWRDTRSIGQRQRDELAHREREKTKIEKTHPPAQRRADAWSYYADTLGGYIFRIIGRQPKEAQKALENIMARFVTNPGSGKLSAWKDEAGRVHGTWEEAVQEQVTRGQRRFENMVAAHGMQNPTDAQLADLRRLLTGGKAPNAEPKVVALAADLRRLMDERWRYLTAAGVEVGYVRNGWLPRIIDKAAVVTDPKTFLAQAKKVYRKVFQGDVRDADLDEQISDVRRIVNMLRKDTLGNEDGGRDRVQRLSDDDEDLVTSWKKAQGVLARLEKQAADLAKKGDDDKADALSEKIGEARERFMELHAEVLDMIEDRWSAMAADHWRVNIMVGNMMDFDSFGPTASFTKKRTLPPEADQLMQEFYAGDALTLVEDFMQAAPRRAEFVRRVGKEGETLRNMLEAAVEAGADGDDIREVKRIINMLTGRENVSGQSASAWVGGWAYVLGTVYMLKRAMWSSLTEATVAALRTGRARDGFRAFLLTVGQIRRSGSAQDRRDLARVVGLVRSAMNETIMLNRFGGDLDPNRRQARALGAFFRYNGLTALTNAQRTAMTAVGADHINRMLLLEAKGDKKAHEELNDLGIPTDTRPDLLEWINSLDGQPKADDLMGVDGDFYNDAAKIWAGALMRFVDTTIQNPRKYTRPGAALDTRYRMAYGITGFIFGFHREILARGLKHGVDARRDGEGFMHSAARQAGGVGLNASKMALFGAPVLLLGHMLSTTVREALFNSEAFGEAEEEDELEEWLMKRAWSRSGLYGAFDIPYNLVTGVRYDNDLAGLYAGPHRKMYLDALQTALELGVGRNGAGNKAENSAVASIGDIIINGGANFALSLAPGGPLLTPLKGIASYGVDIADPSKMIADALFPMDE